MSNAFHSSAAVASRSTGSGGVGGTGTGSSGRGTASSAASDLVGMDATVRIVRGRNLVAMDHHFITRKPTTSDPYVKVVFGGKKFGRTPVMEKTLHPNWDGDGGGGSIREGSTFLLKFGAREAHRIARAEEDDRGQMIELRIVDEDKGMQSDDPMGTVFVPLGPLTGGSGGTSVKWYPVQRGRYGTKHYNKKASGELEVEITTRCARRAPRAPKKRRENAAMSVRPVTGKASLEIRRQIQGNTTGGGVLASPPPEGAIVRNQLAAGRDSSFKRVSEAARLYGRLTKRYVLASSDDARDASRILEQVYGEVESSQLMLFIKYHSEGVSDSQGNLASTDMTKVLIASTELLNETRFLWEDEHQRGVQLTLGNFFERNAAVDCVWVAAVVSTCARQISDHSGGMEGLEMLDFSTNELLDIIAWMHYFRKIKKRIDREVCSGKLEFLERMLGDVDLDGDPSAQPELFRVGNDRAGTVSEAQAMDGLAFVCRALRRVDWRARDELLMRTQQKTLEWSDKAYRARQKVQRMKEDGHAQAQEPTLGTDHAYYTLHSLHETSDGQLFTSLAEDIFTPLSVQLRTISDRLPADSCVIPPLFSVVLSSVRSVQHRERDRRLTTLERRCAAANDFERMGEAWEGIVSEILPEIDSLEGLRRQDEDPSDDDDDEKKRESRHRSEELQAITSELVHTFAIDAVYAARSVVVPVYEPVRAVLEPKFFTRRWEDDKTHNEYARRLAATVEDFSHDLEAYLGPYLYQKAEDAVVRAAFVFYAECLFRKARGRRRGGGGGGGGGGKRSGGGIAADDSGFGDNSRALMRMKGDMAVLRNYFDEIAQFSPSLARTVDAEFKTLRTVYELLSIAGGESSSEPSDFVLLLHGRIGGDPRLTERAVVDLWTLMAPEDEGRVKQFLAEMEDRLADSSGSSKSGGVSHDGGRERIPGLRLDEVVAELYAK